MKVCHFSSAHPATDIRVFHKECVSLAKAGHEVYLVVANSEEKIVEGVHIVSVTSEATGRFSRMLKTAKAVYQKALSLDADVYHFHDPELLRFALKLKRKGKKVIYDAHEDLPKQIMGKYWINKSLRKIVSTSFRKYENYVAKRLDCIITATPFIRDRFLEVNQNSIDINNYPLLKELIADRIDVETPLKEICYIGGITRVRGIVELMDALALLPDVRLNLAGNFESQEFENLIKSKPAWDQVTNYGYVNRSEVVEILKRSKIGMVALLPLPNHIDAQPNKMFEYMSAGIPVIGSDFPLWRAILIANECGLCVDPENPQAIADAIQYLLDHPEIANKMGENGRDVVQNQYNWDKEQQKLIDLYHKLEMQTKN